MEIKTAQQDMQSVFLRGSVGQIVSGLIWLASAVLGTWVEQRLAIFTLVVGGAFIFPLTQLALRLLKHPSALPKGHPFNALAMQVAFIVPFSLPLVGAATLWNENWFYPAFMLLLGVHYMPFIFMYGMWEFGLLAAVLIGGSFLFGLSFMHAFIPGGWFTALALLLFGVLVRNEPR